MKQSEHLGGLLGARAGAVGNRHHDVDVLEVDGLPHVVGEDLAQTQAGGVDVDAVDRGVGTGEVDELEGARMKRGLVGALRERDVALEVDPHGLARLKVTLGLEAQADHRHGLGAHHVLREAVLKLVGAPADRTNAAGIAEGEHALARDHARTASKTAVFVSRRPSLVARESSEASTLRRTSESLVVLRWRRSVS